jgi:transposase
MLGVLTSHDEDRPLMHAAHDGRQIVGIDLHRRRSVIVRMTEAGEKLEAVRIANDPVALGLQIAKAGPDRRWSSRRPTAGTGRWRCCRPPARRCTWRIRWESRDSLRSGLKAQVHAVLAKQGVRVAASDLFGVGGQRLIDQLQLDAPYLTRVSSLRRLIDAVTFEIDIVAKRVDAQLSGHRGYRAIQAIHGVGPVLAAIFVVEIGDVTRFGRPQQLCSWAGLTPRHRESDTAIHRGRITKQGNHLIRRAAVEAVQRLYGGSIGSTRARLTESARLG